MPSISWKLEADKKTITLRLPDHPDIALPLDAAAVDALLAGVGELRRAMEPAHPAAYERKIQLKALADPAWVVEQEAMLGNPVLHVRDQGFGWLHYMIPKVEARKLAALLLEQADAPAPRSRTE
jgi:hypothetical protein